MKKIYKGRYNNDYSPRYCEPYDIYDKAKQHMKDIKNPNNLKSRENPTSENNEKINEHV